MEDWKKRYDKFEKRFWLKMKGRVYYDNYEVVTIKEGWNIEVKRFIEQEIEKAREDIYSEFLEYKKSYIENIWKSGIPDDLIEDTLNNVDDYLKSKLTTK